MIKNISSLKFTIIKINDRCVDQTLKNISILNNLEYVDNIEFCNGNIENAKLILEKMEISTDTWLPYDGRVHPAFPGEYGAWVSNIRVWQFMVKNSIDSLLVLEDDAILNNDSMTILNISIPELPKNWDFLSLFYLSGENQFNKNTDIGSKRIHNTFNQNCSAVTVLYSLAGAKKLLQLVKTFGIEYAHDCFLYKQSNSKKLNGYCIIPSDIMFASHDKDTRTSTIDPTGSRGVPLS